MSSYQAVRCPAAIALLLLATALRADPGNDADMPRPPQTVAAAWVVDPRQPDIRNPPVGRSLFEHLVTVEEDGVVQYRIPFPFSRLIDHIAARLAPGADGRPGIRQVLIPLGRSLVRNTAEPEFFRYPRVVVAAVGQPVTGTQDAGMLLRDRLYIGYSEKAAVLEIISYNEAAGRFEFQLVNGYDGRRQPELVYANRRVCLACHQNGAPIFPRQQWDETSASPDVSRLLREAVPDPYQGVALDHGVDVPGDIDAATDRANYLSLYQLLWGRGCQSGDGGDRAPVFAGVDCRAALLRQVFQYRLSNDTWFDTGGGATADGLPPVLLNNWQHHWPEGLQIPDSDIPNRDPFRAAGTTARPGQRSAPEINVVSAAFEPLVPRVARDRWKRLDAGRARRLVAGLGSFLADTDIERLDQQLFVTGGARAVRRLERLECGMSLLADGDATEVRFSCESGQDRVAGALIDGLRGRFRVRGEGVRDGRLSRLEVPGADWLQGVSLHDGRLVREGDRTGAVFTPYNGRLHVRLPDGRSIESLRLYWDDRPPPWRGRGSAVLSLLDDFSLLEAAIGQQVEDTLAGRTDALGPSPFRRAVILPPLFTSLGLPTLDWCCVEAGSMPALVTETRSGDGHAGNAALREPGPGLAGFYEMCSGCHATAGGFPPAFMRGDRAAVQRQISACAPRILFRLLMWAYPAADRPRSPMPPATALMAHGFTTGAWKRSARLAGMQDYVARLILSETGRQPDPEAHTRLEFSRLRHCMPESLDRRPAGTGSS